MLQKEVLHPLQSIWLALGRGWIMVPRQGGRREVRSSGCHNSEVHWAVAILQCVGCHTSWKVLSCSALLHAPSYHAL